MAFKSFSKLTPRNQSMLISQLHKLVNYYSSTFCSRERVYLKKLSQEDGNIYWLEDDSRKLTAVAILDPNYHLNMYGVEISILGHTISRRPGQMERLFHHLLEENLDRTIGLLCKPFVAESIGFEDFGMTALTPIEIRETAPEIADTITDYFNVRGESLFSGMVRKGHNMYIRFSKKDLETIKSNNPALASKLAVLA